MVAEKAIYSAPADNRAFHDLLKGLYDAGFDLNELHADRFNEIVKLVIWRADPNFAYPGIDKDLGDIHRPNLFVCGLQGDFIRGLGQCATSIKWEIRLDYDGNKLWHVDMQYTVTKKGKRLPTFKGSYGMHTAMGSKIYDFDKNEGWKNFYAFITSLTMTTRFYEGKFPSKSNLECMPEGRGIGALTEAEQKTYARMVWQHWALAKLEVHHLCCNDWKNCKLSYDYWKTEEGAVWTKRDGDRTTQSTLDHLRAQYGDDAAGWESIVQDRQALDRYTPKAFK